MQIHKKLIIVVGLSLALMITLVVLSLGTVLNEFSAVTAGVERNTQEMQRLEDIAKEIGSLTRDLHYYAESRELSYRQAADISRTLALDKLASLERRDPDANVRELAGSLRANVMRLAGKAERLYDLNDPVGSDRKRGRALLMQIDLVTEQAERDIERHFRGIQKTQIMRMGDNVDLLRIQVVTLIVIILVLSVGFLLGFGVYIYRNVALPLKDLQNGADEISRGNLDLQMKLQGAADIELLAAQFNQMAMKLKQSYSELEQKLLDRTHELAAIDSVALTLSQSSNLHEMLTRSLSKILESLTRLDPRGGIFLCDPDGENLRLVAHQGLSAEFVRAEEKIRMGECLCGIAAQTGEILYSDRGCTDPRHSRHRDVEEHAHIIIPIKSRGIVLGVVFLYPQEQFKLKPSDLQMLDTIGAQLGMAVENLRFYAEVKESSEKFWDLFEYSRDILFTLDTAGVLTAVNRAAEKFTGYAKNDLIGRNVLEFLPPEGAASARRMLQGEGVSARQVIEFEVVKRDGSRAFIEMSARKIVRNRMTIGYQISARDMTEQKMMRAKILQAERLGAIGEIVIAVRHEINNPLTTVIGNIELLLERYGSVDKDLTKRLEAVLNNSLRIAEIVQKLQGIKKDKVVDYVKGVPMTDLKQEDGT